MDSDQRPQTPVMPETIDTARLHLRPWRFQDEEDVLAYAQDPEWARFLPVPQPYRRQHAQQFLARQVLLDREQTAAYAIEHQGRVVGGINVRFSAGHRIGEVGYAIGHPWWGQGLVTEAARAVVDHAFRTYPQLARVRAMADARNRGSTRVMEKIGMTREGRLRQNRLHRDELVDEVWYGILRPEWAKRGAGTEE